MENKIIVDKSKLNHYKFKITALSPLHIGSGEVYEPTNFVIDDKNLYGFDEILFYKALNLMDQKVFDGKLQDWMSVIRFYKDHRDVAKKISLFHIPVTKKVEEKYNTIVNKDGTKNRNQFEIHRIQRNPNTKRVIVPGSSIKGMLDTVFKIYPAKIKDNAPRQALIISDALEYQGTSEVGFSYRKHKYPGKESKSQIPQIVEVIKKGSSFIVSISTDKALVEISSLFQAYLVERKETRFSFPKEGFVGRLGKFCGKEYMVDDGRNVLNTYDKPVATHTLYEEEESEFGWVEFSLLSEVEYQKILQNIKEQENCYREELDERQGDIVRHIATEKEAKRKAQEEKVRRDKEDVDRLTREKSEEKAKVAAMTPVDKLIYKYDDISVLINDMKSGNIDDFEVMKLELAQKIKIELEKDPSKWEKAKKKALIRKEYIETLL